MATGQDTILGTDTVKDALKTKVNDDMTELFAVSTEVTNARDGESTLLAKEQAQDAAILAVTAANGSLVSSNDTTPGFLNGKMVDNTDLGELTEQTDGGDESLAIEHAGMEANVFSMMMMFGG